MKRIAASEFKKKDLGRIYLEKRPQGNPGTSTKIRYKRKICSFDIETSKVKTGEHTREVNRNGKKETKTVETYDSFMYIWKLHICDYWEGKIAREVMITGRTWEEFLHVLDVLAEGEKEHDYFVIYVHNLSYEFQFIAGIYDFIEAEVFATEKRQVLRCYIKNHFEFRCSYRLTNQSLATFLKDMAVEHQKTKDLDYNIVRYPWTPLTEKEENYCDNDVRGLSEALCALLTARGDTLYTIPMTRTGYVRREVKRAMRAIPHYSAAKINPDYNVYLKLEKAFRGGDTHANRYYVGKVVKNVRSADFESDYPAIMLCETFPTDQFTPEPCNEVDEIIDKVIKRGKALLSGIRLTGVTLRNKKEGFPYLSTAKCSHLKKCVEDNGRVLSSDYLETYITNLDLEIILDQYNFENIEFFDTYTANQGQLPEAFKEVIREFYATKTELKGVKGQEMEYGLRKGDLNSSYGMLVQKMVREAVRYIDGEFIAEESGEHEYNITRRKAFLVYQWGVWTTAHARYRLHALRRYIEAEKGTVVYGDTDSNKFIETRPISFEKFNKPLKALAEKYKATAIDAKGVKHYIGIADIEETAEEFRTWGAKRYAASYRNDKGELYCKITVAGVDKKEGSIEIEKAGGIEAFSEDFTFIDGGGTTVQYNDKPNAEYVTDPETGRKVKLTRNCSVVDTTYTMGLKADYKRIIDAIAADEKTTKARGFSI